MIKLKLCQHPKIFHKRMMGKQRKRLMPMNCQKLLIYSKSIIKNLVNKSLINRNGVKKSE